VQVPSDATQWEGIARDFYRRWNFPNVVGALDGKHIVIQKPSNSGSMFYTYKHTFAIQLLALVDADYNFIYVDVGCQGRIGDAGVFHHSSLSKALAQNTLGIPDRTLLPNSSTQCSYTLLADEAFPLTTYLMKPYARRGLTVRERIFNYRLSRARRVVENAFGILAHRFRIFLQPVVLHPSKVTDVVLAAVTLHNFLKQTATNGSSYLGDGEVDVEDVSTGTVVQGNWRGDKSSRGMVNLLPVRGNQRSNAKAMRDELADYFVNEGSVSWQWQHAHSV